MVADGWMALADVLTRTAQSNALVNCDVVAHNCRFTNYHAHAVVDEHPVAKYRTGVNFYAGSVAAPLRKNARYKFKSVFVQKMHKPVAAHRTKAWVA